MIERFGFFLLLLITCLDDQLKKCLLSCLGNEFTSDIY